MVTEKDPWFVVERSEALAGLLLTSRRDLEVVKETRRDNGVVDFLVSVRQGEQPPRRIFAVQVKGTANGDQAQWMSSLGHVLRANPGVYTPACLLVVDVRSNQAFFAWVAEPSVEPDGARLHFAGSPEFHPVEAGTLDDIVSRVNAWYDKLPANLGITSSP